MELVVDTNVLVAGFLRSTTTRELLLDERLTLWAPEYLLTEAERVLLTPRLRRRLGALSPDEVRVVLMQLTERIRVLPVNAFRVKLPEAKTLVADQEDTPFIALALHLQLPLWAEAQPVPAEPGTVFFIAYNVS
ncbi:MAG: putative toxin-antitoxin system toxin component, PIN family [Candidatus Omnitrophica bacterium]|nr:putative toxin-antitoxin system toxin component, PIN family [Candidatus Omnitrophota bacterium]